MERSRPSSIYHYYYYEQKKRFMLCCDDFQCSATEYINHGLIIHSCIKSILPAYLSCSCISTNNSLLRIQRVLTKLFCYGFKNNITADPTQHTGCCGADLHVIFTHWLSTKIGNCLLYYVFSRDCYRMNFKKTSYTYCTHTTMT